MKAPALFEFETQAVRVVSGEGGEAWFVASDIASVLEYRNASDMTRHLDEDEKGTRNVRTLGGEQEMTIINEAGLYSAILKSRKPAAKRFKRWVTHDVLPSLRKTGSYSLGEKLTVNQQISMSKHRLGLVKELMRTRNRTVRDLLGVEITKLSTAMGLPIPDLDTIGSVEPTQADIVADFWAALLQLDSKGIVYNHSKDPQLIGLNMPHLGELFAANGIQTVLNTEMTTALKRCSDPQFLGLKAVDSTLRRTTTKCWVFRKPAQIQAQ